ncbi:elongin BC and Polycomb repressive complex 2-associated protein-like [Poecile atricapillus]|uniref:elongin BC and Polycomb repressive complex 2-associated protein-like n=1 Tax=Poecile atricapillus TaxID=48891 RepID=UPI00273822FE|nr:elongin BC and Polycomb repressive complex 2-associated protein-like [Poecile atricapillus]
MVLGCLATPGDHIAGPSQLPRGEEPRVRRGSGAPLSLRARRGYRRPPGARSRPSKAMSGASAGDLPGEKPAPCSLQETRAAVPSLCSGQLVRAECRGCGPASRGRSAGPGGLPAPPLPPHVTPLGACARRPPRRPRRPRPGTAPSPPFRRAPARSLPAEPSRPHAEESSEAAKQPLKPSRPRDVFKSSRSGCPQPPAGAASQPGAASGARAVRVLFRRPLPLPRLWHLTVRPSVAVHTGPALLPGRSSVRGKCPPRSCPKESPDSSAALARAVPAAVFVTEAPLAACGKAAAVRGAAGGEGRGLSGGSRTAAPREPRCPSEHPAPTAAFLTGSARVLGPKPLGNAKTAHTQPLPTSDR